MPCVSLDDINSVTINPAYWKLIVVSGTVHNPSIYNSDHLTEMELDIIEMNSTSYSKIEISWYSMFYIHLICGLFNRYQLRIRYLILLSRVIPSVLYGSKLFRSSSLYSSVKFIPLLTHWNHSFIQIILSHIFHALHKSQQFTIGSPLLFTSNQSTNYFYTYHSNSSKQSLFNLSSIHTVSFLRESV